MTDEMTEQPMYSWAVVLGSELLEVIERWEMISKPTRATVGLAISNDERVE